MTSGMTLPEGLLDRIALIEAKAAIADVVHGYAHAIRHGRGADAAALFMKDGTFEMRDGLPGRQDFQLRNRLEGRVAVQRYLTQEGGPATAIICPMIHNLIIDVAGSTARASSVMMGQVLGSSHSILGEYEDSFRFDGTWLFAARIYTIFPTGQP